MSPPGLNTNCALVRRTGQPVYESCRSCELRIENCIQFRGQLYAVGLLCLLLGMAFLPLPAWARGLLGFAATGVVLWFQRYVGRESHVSIVTAARLRVERADALGLAAKLDQHVVKLEETRTQLIRADKLATVGTMAAGVAHEINNPLAFVLSNLRFVREELQAAGTPVGDELISALTEAESGGQRVRTIVSELKCLARDEAPKRGPVDLREVMRSALAIARNELRHKATLVERYDDPPPALGDAGQLNQVFLNLLVNAAQAMPAGRVSENRLELRIRQEGQSVVTEVCDTGEGIAPEHLPRLFDPFFTTKPAGQGTGLGLAICHSLVAAMGGDITVHSELGKGTCFRVTLPLADEDDEQTPTLPANPPVRETPRRGRVLVVDDEPLVAHSVERMLRRDHEVVTSTDPREALRSLAVDDSFDAVVCDVMMPNLTGAEFFDALKTHHAHLTARTVFITGGAFTPRARAFLDSLTNACVEKPIDEDRLRSLVAELTVIRPGQPSAAVGEE